MANIKSQKKRIEIGARNEGLNSTRKAEVRTAIKKVEVLAANGKKAEAEAACREAISLLDRYAQLKTLTVNSVARKKAHLCAVVAKIK